MNPRVSLPPLLLLSGLMLMQLWLGSPVCAQEPRREKVTPALTRELTRRPLTSSASDMALGRARAAMAAQDFATAYKEYRVAADSTRGVAGLEKVRAEAVLGLCQSGVKLAQQRKAEGKTAEAEKTLREILSAPYNPRYAPALELLATLRPTVAPKIQGFTVNPSTTPATTPLIPVDTYIRRATPPPAATLPPETPTMAAAPKVTPRTKGDSPPTTVTREPASVDTTEKRATPPPATSPAPAAAEDRHLVKVYFGTDRRATGKQGASGRFGIEWNNKTPEDPVITGVVTVSIPPGHKEGIIERPSWLWPRNEDPAKDFVLKELRVTKSNDFYQELRGDFDRRAEEDRSAFVYVHGFNVTFDDAAYATAQIVFDLDFKGVPMMFSWPSQGTVLAYDGDQETVDFSAPNLQGFLERVARETGAKRIHLMAHSMGNRLLTRALSELVRQPDIQPLFDNVIMASPDLNAQLFTRLWPKIKIAAKRFTLYASSDDKALAASRTSKGGDTFTRLGEGGPNIVVIPGLDTIDASGIDTSELGHSYEFTCKPVRLDLGKLIGQGIPPDKRQLHETHTREGLAYWRFR